jgi:hypothetical protein
MKKGDLFIVRLNIIDNFCIISPRQLKKAVPKSRKKIMYVFFNVSLSIYYELILLFRSPE